MEEDIWMVKKKKKKKKIEGVGEGDRKESKVKKKGEEKKFVGCRIRTCAGRAQ